MDAQDDMQGRHGTVFFSRPDARTLLVHLAGAWRLGPGMPGPEEAIREAGKGARFIAFDSTGLEAWDSSLLAYLDRLRSLAGSREMEIDAGGLPGGVRRMLKIASEAGVLQGLPETRERQSFLSSVGSSTLALGRSLSTVLRFAGAAFLSILSLIRGRARFRTSDMNLLLYQCGAQALPIVSLISVLVGLILGFVGVVELQEFGVQIYIADLVGVAMAREMGAMMTAIIMTGRTGAAYATQLGTMETNEEVDALKTLGLSPMEFLVMPRTLALALMMPLLTVYADIMGILGGGLVGVMFGIPAGQYYEESLTALYISAFAIGVVKSVFFAFIIALSGCFYGMHTDRSASAVGQAATRSVVTGIVLIVVADGIFAVITTVLDI